MGTRRNFLRKAALLSGVAGMSTILPKSIQLPLGVIDDSEDKRLEHNIKKTKEYEVAVYYYPGYHPDNTNSRWHGKDWTEWNLIKDAKPRFEGHEQPKHPSWGYFNEANPKWSAKEIDLASSNGIDVFIYDWYWYPSVGRFLQGGLEDGFLKAPNCNRMKFAIMWANHNWENIQPATYDDHRITLANGEISGELWDKISSYLVEEYFKRPNYWKIDGKPYFSIYEIVNFVNGLGGMENARKGIDLLDKKTKEAGFQGLHFNIMDWEINDESSKQIKGVDAPQNAKEMLRILGCESASTYTFLHHFDVTKAGFPTVPYSKALEENKEYWRNFIENYPDILYTPNVSMGWDPSPRCMQSDNFGPKIYPWTSVLVNNTPEAFKGALIDAKNFLDNYNPKHKIVVLNAWNEWTEGSFLLPESKHGDAYLKAIKEVFDI